ncbi:hypothetical protein SAMN04488603_10425 [Paenibacillus sp. cl130]|nr:hypothetical protein SAMN04488603_10425 [Paenibacillus sp. cl130]
MGDILKVYMRLTCPRSKELRRDLCFLKSKNHIIKKSTRYPKVD